MEIISNITKHEAKIIIDVLRKNKIKGEEKDIHLMMFTEAKINAKIELIQLDEFLIKYCNFWNLKI